MTSPTKQQMIVGAADLLARRGLQGTSFRELIAATGAPRGSLYHHFPGGKDELVAEATRYVAEVVVAQLRAQEPASAEAAVVRFADMWRQVLVGSDLRAGCTVAAVAIAAVDDDPLLELSGEVFRSWQGGLAELLRSAGLPAAGARDLATLVVAAMEGALILCRAERRLEPFDAVVRQLRRLARAADRAADHGRTR